MTASTSTSTPTSTASETKLVDELDEGGAKDEVLVRAHDWGFDSGAARFYAFTGARRRGRNARAVRETGSNG